MFAIAPKLRSLSMDCENGQMQWPAEFPNTVRLPCKDRSLHLKFHAAASLEESRILRDSGFNVKLELRKQHSLEDDRVVTADDRVVIAELSTKWPVKSAEEENLAFLGKPLSCVVGKPQTELQEGQRLYLQHQKKTWHVS